jgi:hypothetical protein
VTRQLTELGMLHDEFERGYDWFHQGESLLLLYFLCMAAPERWAERALRFAELYVDPAKGNYDPEHHIITRPHNGSDPDRQGLSDGDAYPWLPSEAQAYGFPLDWILPDDAPSPPLSDDPRLGQEMRERMGVGDTAVNLAAAGLVLNAWILSGDHRYRDWIVEYVGAWRKRAEANGGMIPDNVGPDGVVGSLHEGRWYGGHYGWSWPHGWHSVGHAACVAALAAATVTGDDDYLSFVGAGLDTLLEHGRTMAFTEADSSLQSKWLAQLGPDIHTPTLHIPFRRDDSGWFDHNPVTPAVPWLCGTTRPPRPTMPGWSGSVRPAVSIGVPCGPSGRRRSPGTRRHGSPSSPATIPTTRSGSSPRPRPRSATGSPAWTVTVTSTCPRRTSTCGSSRTRLSPRRSSSSPGAALRSSTTAVCNRPGCDTTTPPPAARACRRTWLLW